jgi:sortase A
MSYLYVKRTTKLSPFSFRSAKLKKILSLFFLFLGLSLLASALYPIVDYQLAYSTHFSLILDPRSTHSFNQKLKPNPPKVNAQEIDSKDYSLISSWFEISPDTLSPSQNNSQPVQYSLAIPKLKINHASVRTDNQDLKKSLIQYPNTAPPGQLGNTVVFGHSVLPQFFEPNNYYTIFSTLYTLSLADPVYLTYDGVTYTYRVEEIFEVLPTDLSVLEQRFDQRTLTLITCTPPGTYLKRLIIRARIVD